MKYFSRKFILAIITIGVMVYYEQYDIGGAVAIAYIASVAVQDSVRRFSATKYAPLPESTVEEFRIEDNSNRKVVAGVQGYHD